MAKYLYTVKQIYNQLPRHCFSILAHHRGIGKIIQGVKRDVSTGTLQGEESCGNESHRACPRERKEAKSQLATLRELSYHTPNIGVITSGLMHQ